MKGGLDVKVVKVKVLANESLCTSCGTCSGICPQGAIQLIRDERRGILLPYVDEEKCTNCGLCLEVCPGREINFIKMNWEVFGKIPRDPFIGNYIRCYIGYARDLRIRLNGASGGIITALLLFLLEEEIIDGVVVAVMREYTKPKPYVIRKPKDLLAAQGSIYMPVPMGTIIKYIMRHEERYAIVGLPCHIEGLRKAERLFRELRERIILRVGLFCGGIINLLGHSFILRKMKVDVNNVKNIKYRGRGWPGYIRIILRDRKEKRVPFIIFWSLVYPFFLPIRCILCLDPTNELADLSCGDAWLPEIIKRDRIGTSLIITRTKKGDELVRRAIEKHYIEAVETTASDVIRSQGTGLLYRKIDNVVRRYMLKKLGLQVPKYVYPYSRSNITSYLRTFITYLKLMCGRYQLNGLIDLYSLVNRAYYHRKYYP